MGANDMTKVVQFCIGGLLLLSFGKPLQGKSLTAAEWTLNFTQTYCTPTQQVVCNRSMRVLYESLASEPVCPATQAEIRAWGGVKCIREPTGWRWFYVAELDPPFTRIIKEHSLEERLANIIDLTSIAKAYKNDINFFKFNARSGEQNRLNQQMVCGKRVDDALCLLHLQHMEDTMRDLESKLHSRWQDYQSEPALEDRYVHLARILDSFGRYSSGHLSGRFHVFGAYDQCVKSQLLLGGGQKVRTRYCVANLQLTDYLSRPVRERRRYPHETGDAMLHVGVCVPESCHSKSFNQDAHKMLIKRIVDTQFLLPQTLYKRKNLNLDSVFCLVDDDSEYESISIGGRLLASGMAIWLLAICYHSLGNAARQNPNHPLNVSGYIGKLFNGRPASNETVDLEALQSTKVVAQMTIIMLHAGSFMGGFTNDCLSCANFAEKDSFPSALMMFTSMVDTFFVLNGIIHTYNLLRQLEARAGHGNTVASFLRYWFKFVLKRYLRLVSMLFLVFAFKKTLFVHLNNGPMWDKGLNQDTNMGYCLQKQSWLSIFDLFSNLRIQLPYNCVTVSWSIANEIIFASILPPIVYLIHCAPKRGTRLVGIIIIISTISCYRAHHQADPAASFDLRDLRSYGGALLSTMFHHLYVNPFFRLSGFLVGVLGGWYVKRQFTKASPSDEEPLSWPWWFKKPITRLCLLIHLTNFVLSCKVGRLRTIISPYHRTLLPNIACTNRLIFSVAYVVIFLRISTDWRKSNWFVRNLAVGKFWTILSKLNYLLLLVHWDVMTYDYGIRTQEIFCSRWVIWSLFASAYLSSLALSALLHILVQNPLNCLLQRFLLDRI